MKFFLAAAFSLLAAASAKKENWVSEPTAASDGKSDFEYLLSMGMDNQLGSQLAAAGAHGIPEGQSFTAAIEVPEIADQDEREMFFGRLCDAIERLFTGTVRCECSPQILAGIIFYECDSVRDVNRNNRVAFTPNFFGGFAYQIFAMEYDFVAGYCLDDFSVYVRQLEMFLNIGDLCISADYEIDVTLNPPAFEGGIAACTFLAGNYGACEVCQSCIAPNGDPGFTVVCDFLPVAPCAPFALPRNRASKKTDIRKVADGINVDELIKDTVAELIAEQEAGGDAPEDEEEEEEEEEEDTSSGFVDGDGPPGGKGWWSHFGN